MDKKQATVRDWKPFCCMDCVIKYYNFRADTEKQKTAAVNAMPELLEALKGFMAEHVANGHHGIQPTCHNCAWAEKIIAKAEGKALE